MVCRLETPSVSNLGERASALSRTHSFNLSSY